MNLTVSVAGTDALSLKVKRLIAAAREGLKFGVSEAAFIIETEAKSLVPVQTGNLRESIHTVQLVDEPEKQVMGVTPGYPAGNRYGFDPAYARRIEFGFIGPDSMGRTFHQPAQSYMRAAHDTKKEEAREAIKSGVLDTLQGARAGAV